MAYAHLSKNFKKPHFCQSIKQYQCMYIFYELTQVMCDVTMDVVQFYSKQQLKLHNTVHVREDQPTHTEGNEILNTIDFIKAGFQLMENLINRGAETLLEHKDGLIELLAKEMVNDINANFEHLYDVITDMNEELNNIKLTVNDIINRRNEQIGIVLSLVATIFLPLTFISGNESDTYRKYLCIYTYHWCR